MTRVLVKEAADSTIEEVELLAGSMRGTGLADGTWDAVSLRYGPPLGPGRMLPVLLLGTAKMGSGTTLLGAAFLGGAGVSLAGTASTPGVTVVVYCNKVRRLHHEHFSRDVPL